MPEIITTPISRDPNHPSFDPTHSRPRALWEALQRTEDLNRKRGYDRNRLVVIAPKHYYDGIYSPQGTGVAIVQMTEPSSHTLTVMGVRLIEVDPSTLQSPILIYV